MAIAEASELRKASHKKMPYWCTDCRSYFSIKSGTPMANSKVSTSQVGNRHLPLLDEPEEHIEHEAASGY